MIGPYVAFVHGPCEVFAATCSAYGPQPWIAIRNGSMSVCNCFWMPKARRAGAFEGFSTLRLREMPQPNPKSSNAGQRAHMVLKIGSRIIQPAEKDMILRAGQSVGAFLGGFNSERIALSFTSDVFPQDLDTPVKIILIDGDGNRFPKTVDLKGILDVSRQ
jgi:hypothetical protein